MKTEIEAQKKLRFLEKEEKHAKQITLKEKGVFQRKKNTISTDEFKNECTRRKDDKYELFDYPKYNKNSKFYKAREATEHTHESHLNKQRKCDDNSDKLMETDYHSP